MRGRGFRGHVLHERGAALLEFGLLVALFAVVALVVVGAAGFEVQDFFDDGRLDIAEYLP